MFVKNIVEIIIQPLKTNKLFQEQIGAHYSESVIHSSSVSDTLKNF